MATIPTLQLGNNNWAVRDDKLLGYYIVDGKWYAPREFAFARTSIGTQTNRSGLIGTSVADNARADFLNNTKGSLLLEPSRTNLWTYSEQLDNGVWIPRQTVITAGTLAAPDGAITAETITEDSTASSAHDLTRGIVGLTDATDYCLSIFYNNLSLDRNFGISSGNSWTGAAVNIIYDSNGDLIDASGDYVDYGIETYANGWYRIWVALTSSGTSASTVPIARLYDGVTNVYNGNGTSSVDVWGADFEQGSYPTTYIPTAASTVNRGVDTLSLSGLQASGIFGATEGSIFLEHSPYNSPSNVQFEFRNSSAALIFRVYSYNGASFRCFYNADGSWAMALERTGTKLALKFNATELKFYVDGVNTDTYNPTAAPNDINAINNLTTASGAILLDEMQFYPAVLTDQELIDLTT